MEVPRRTLLTASLVAFGAKGDLAVASGPGAGAAPRPDLTSDLADNVAYIPAGSGAVLRTAAEKFAELRTLEDFGAVGDGQIDGTGTDDTAAVQAAIDWAYGGGETAGRALLITAKNFLVGRITTHPHTTLVGTGRHTSAFLCKTGTTGHWWSDRGNGAQKLMLSGIAFYGRNNPALTAVAHFGFNGTQFGTEGIIQGCWFRDAPNGYGLACDANVGIFNDITFQSCRAPFFLLGNGNVGQNLIAMQAGLGTTGAVRGGPAHVVGMDLTGMTSGKGLHIEAPISGSLPLRLYGDCSVSDVLFSPPNERPRPTYSHLVEVNTLNYDEWTLAPLSLLNGGTYTVTNGIIRVGNPAGGMAYLGGTNPIAFSGTSVMSKVANHSGVETKRDQLYQAFQIRITNERGVVRHRIGSVGDSGLAGTYCTKILGSSTSLTATPRGAEAFAAGASLQGSGATLVLNTANPQDEASQTAVANRLAHNTGVNDLSVFANVSSYTVGGVRAKRLGITFSRSDGTPFDLSAMRAGWFVDVAVVGYIA